MIEFRTEGFNGCGVKYSPFFDSRLAVAASANFGLVGNGRFYIFNLTAQGIVPLKWYTTQDALYDLAWSEVHENQAVVASGDGSIKLFDLTLDEFPVQAWKEHTREVFAVHWNLVAKDRFCSSSWDGTVKIWTPERPTSLLTLPTHSCTYSAAFSPHSPDIVSCVSSDSYVRVFDLRTPASASNHLTIQIPIHGSSQIPMLPKTGLTQNLATSTPSEALTHDWNKYRSSVLATGGVDRTIRTFDIRAPQQGPLCAMLGHEYAVRKVAWSPHLSHVLLSAGYDMTCRVWTDGSDVALPGMDADTMRAGPASTMGRELGRMGRHTEFVTGVDWCLFGSEGWCASCGWDERLCVWDARAFMA
ncbi:peroxisomal targeting signal 2 receptor [Ophidiomyces ophidiicola]|uniref:Peroxisomal targeting signal 2 receptor n=1 Tax=Ophidiomyces ophidiicola TaxID=1387563 RepID=A0ACB8V4S1_9EURO|nr:peroxisomal targeting signal 2 receptor [Ophidiomyces ophidiicola]KAI1915443.1 peroxisomal targeting signal 2 receptor [Ophidiomyces ophidiicola]KAI1926057.1 peroxisomal targeting signal 2 receptor [Ophidiomyces ophidiicola]KAI1929882.1 peroxisomal targeting signal 2 receptor [Ophidiomyces ophidiicola]KAI1947174.1 peroxisomal targeting signal 2 receptor [Ophidiomyces ophidiicola]KAI1955690.1 peroxisomal targeting signal 2 receptor [Ophidiomyces ophidiicola]